MWKSQIWSRSTQQNFGTRFTSIRLLGRGGMGSVWEVHDLEHDRRVALKALSEASPEGLLAFKREFRSLQQLDHPNIVSFGELLRHEGSWFFTMDLVSGEDIVTYVRAGGEVDLERLRSSFAQLALALAAIHDGGLVHRDIKPANIKVTSDGRVVLLDFGLVSRGDDAEDSASGTVAYMAPEQASSDRLCGAADCYALGVILFKVFEGRLPFEGSHLEILMNKQKVEAPSIGEQWPREMAALVAELLEFDPLNRPGAAKIALRLGTSTSDDGYSTFSGLSISDHFLGRDHELDALDRFFEASRYGGRLVIVHGSSGFGKSALIDQACRRFAEQGNTLILQGRCYPRESIPFKAFDQVIDRLVKLSATLSESELERLYDDPDAGLLSRMFPVLGSIDQFARAPLTTGRGDQLELRQRAGAALQRIIARFAKRAPLVVVLEDLHWADADSIALLAELLQPESSPCWLLVVSTRDSEALLKLLERDHGWTLSSRTCTLIDVGPLKHEAAVELTTRLLQRFDVDRQHAESIATEAKGDPLLIQELAHQLAADPDRRPERRLLVAAVRQRVAALPPAAVAILELSAVAHIPLTEGHFVSAFHFEIAEVRRSISQLRVSHLLRRTETLRQRAVEFYHYRILEVVLSELSSSRLRELHRILATTLERHGSRPERLIPHFVACGQTDRAYALAVEAANRTASGLAFDRAAELLHTAVELCPEGEERRRQLRGELAKALARVGRGVEAAEVSLQAAEGADLAAALELRTRAAELRLISGLVDEGLEVLEKLLEAIGANPSGRPLRALLSVLWHRLLLRLHGLTWEGRDGSEIPRRELLKLDVLIAAGQGLSMVDNIRGADYQARAMLGALRLGEPRRLIRCLCTETAFESSRGLGGVRRAGKLFKALEGLVADLDDPEARAQAEVIAGLRSYFGCRWQRSVEQLESGLIRLRELGSLNPFFYNNARLFRIFSLRHLGRFDRWEPAYRADLRDARMRGDRYLETSLRLYSALLHLARDQPGEATWQLEQSTWTPPGDRFHIQHWYAIEARCEIALYIGRVEAVWDEACSAFDGLKRSFLTRVSIIDVLALFLRGRLVLARKDLDDAEAARVARRIARRIRRVDLGFVESFASTLDAGAAARLGEESRAIAALRLALLGAEAFSQELQVHALQARLAQMLGGEEGRSFDELARRGFESIGVKRPARMTGLAVPGWFER